MLRLLSSKVPGGKDFWKISKPCHAGIHWIAFAEQGKLHLKFTCPTGTFTCPATLLNNGYIARTLPKTLLAEQGKLGTCSACLITVFAKFTHNLQRGKWLCCTLVVVYCQSFSKKKGFFCQINSLIWKFKGAIASYASLYPGTCCKLQVYFWEDCVCLSCLFVEDKVRVGRGGVSSRPYSNSFEVLFGDWTHCVYWQYTYPGQGRLGVSP